MPSLAFSCSLPLLLALLVAASISPPAAAALLDHRTHQIIGAANPGTEDRHGGAVLVTGATGRTGSLLYSALKRERVPVRALVRNASKAREMLGCNACDESEGIYLGDVTDAASLAAPMRGARALVILTSSYPLKYPNGTWYFPPGGSPKEIDWVGSNNQVRAALKAGVQHVLLVSSMGTTQPDSFLDQLAGGHVMWYKLNGEADLMASGLPYTIIKPGGLLSTEGGRSLLLVGHDDNLQHARVAREDVAAVLLAALQDFRSSAYLRFDLSSDDTKPASGDFRALFDEARAWGRDTA